MKLTRQQVAKIIKLAAEGLSERKIAKKIGCSRSAVWYHIQKELKA